MTCERVAGLRVFERGGRPGRGGNLLLLDDTPGSEALLKIYRRRGGRIREKSKRLWYLLMERKRGVTARERFTLERGNLALWRELGFDVPALIDRPLPPGLGCETAQWIEYCPGRLLYAFVKDPSIPRETRILEVARFGGELARRQARARELRELRLVMKHASIKHVLLYAGRQVSFDLEGSYAPGFPMLDALADELASFLRSLWRGVPETDREALAQAFLDGYGHLEQVAAIADFGLRRGGVSRAVRRVADRRKRKDFSEYDALSWVEARLHA